MKENNENSQDNNSIKIISNNNDINKVELFDKIIKQINVNVLKERKIFKNDEKELIDNLYNIFLELNFSFFRNN